MKKNIAFWLLLVTIFITNDIQAQEKSVYLYQVDPLEKVLKDRRYFRDQVDTMRVARGETASIQIVLKANKEMRDVTADIDHIRNDPSTLQGETGWVGYVRVGRRYSPASKDVLRSVSGFFPDPILTDTTLHLQQGEVQPLWITVPVPSDARPGLYTGMVTITGWVNKQKEEYQKAFYIRVYPVTMEETSLLVSNWSAHYSPQILGYLKKALKNPLLFFDLLFVAEC